jgi:hypothetical protein
MLGGVLLDDRSGPALRDVVGTLLRQSAGADFAIGNVRLAAIDLTSFELAHISACRLLMDRLDVGMLADTACIARDNASVAANLVVLKQFAATGRLMVRATGSLCWSPDFSVMHGLPVSSLAPAGGVCLVGAHYFSRPVIPGGASLTCVITGGAAVMRARERFEDLWNRGHDVLPVVRELLKEVT